MESDVKNPTWKMIGGYIVVIALLIFIALMVSSCGSRRSNVSIDNSKTKQEEKSKSEGSVTKESSKTEEKLEKETNADVNEDLKQTVTELYNENGTLKSRIIELQKSKQDKSSSKERKSLRTELTKTDSLFKTEAYKFITITTHKKDKETESSNKQWAWVAGIVLVVLVLAYFVYRYFTRPKA